MAEVTSATPNIGTNSISEYQTNELNRLKKWFYRQRTRARGGASCETAKKEEEAARTKNEQPALFEF